MQINCTSLVKFVDMNFDFHLPCSCSKWLNNELISILSHMCTTWRVCKEPFININFRTHLCFIVTFFCTGIIFLVQSFRSTDKRQGGRSWYFMARRKNIQGIELKLSKIYFLITASCILSVSSEWDFDLSAQREITQVMQVNSYYISSSSNIIICSLQEEVTFTPRLIAVDLKGSLNTLKQEGILYETNQHEDIKW